MYRQYFVIFVFLWGNWTLYSSVKLWSVPDDTVMETESSSDNSPKVYGSLFVLLISYIQVKFIVLVLLSEQVAFFL